MKEISKRQRQVLNFVRSYINQRGYPPAMSEIADFLGIYVSSVFAHLGALEKKGYIERVPGKPRTITIKETA